MKLYFVYHSYEVMWEPCEGLNTVNTCLGIFETKEKALSKVKALKEELESLLSKNEDSYVDYNEAENEIFYGVGDTSCEGGWDGICNEGEVDGGRICIIEDELNNFDEKLF